MLDESKSWSTWSDAEVKLLAKYTDVIHRFSESVSCGSIESDNRRR